LRASEDWPPNAALASAALKGRLSSAASATTGSTCAARRAGTKLAARLAAASAIGTVASTSGSRGWTWYRSGCSGPVASRPRAAPSARPSPSCTVDRLMTSRMSSQRCAPRAVRIPISRVRCVTENDITP
jgi:hypothetical protein